MNQVKETGSGSKVYFSRVLKGQDTLVTVNGARVLRADSRASNGLMQVVDRLLVPDLYTTAGDALSAEISLTLFYHGLKRSGLLAEMGDTESYTLYVPNNTAMQAYGYADVAAVDAANPAVLKAFLSYHIARERKFAQDYFLLAASGKTSYEERMLDGRVLTINLLSQSNVPNSFTGITVKGIANTRVLTPTRTDVLAGNAVIHVLNEVLR